MGISPGSSSAVSPQIGSKTGLKKQTNKNKTMPSILKQQGKSLPVESNCRFWQSFTGQRAV